MKRKFSKILGVGLTLALLASLLMTAAPVVAEDPYPDPPAPQMEAIYPLSPFTDDTYITLTGTVELVFDFHDEEGDLYDLMIDWCLEPYDQDRKAQTNFLATEDMGIDPDVLDAMAEVGLVPSYNAEEQSWTLTIDTNAVMTETIFATGIFGWVEAVGDPVFPDGRYDWFIEVRDQHYPEGDSANYKWGYNDSPPEYAHYVCYFASESSTVGLNAATPTIVAISVDPTNIDFGTINPGTPVSGDPITVDNIGTVTVAVSAFIDPTGGAFAYLYLNTVDRPNTGSWSPTDLGMANLLPTKDAFCSTELIVPETYSAKGSESTTLIFVATQTQTP